MIIAAVAAGVTGVILVSVLAWRLSDDGGWWAVVVLRVTSWLAIGKVGFKVALGVLFGAVALAAWLRGRRRDTSDAGRPGARGPRGDDA